MISDITWGNHAHGPPCLLILGTIFPQAEYLWVFSSLPDVRAIGCVMGQVNKQHYWGKSSCTIIAGVYPTAYVHCPPDRYDASAIYAGLETEVVNDPLSTYVPLKYQSSAPVPSFPERGSRSTPKCQSAPLDEVLVENGPAVLVSASEPVECQKVTCPAEKSYCSERQPMVFVWVVIRALGIRETYNLVGNIVPHIRNQLHLPLALSADKPLQVCVARAALSVDPPVFQLREVTLEERNLVLVCGAGHIRRASLD